jgi:citrate synthase
MDALRAGVAHLRVDDDLDALAGFAVIAAAAARARASEPPRAPDPSLGHAADYLRMSSGGEPASARQRSRAHGRAEVENDAASVAALESYLVTVADHALSASTFAARVVASTGSDTVSAVVAALGALKGPLHGGAPGPVLDMLDAVGTPERAVPWIEGELAGGRRIMGMGHRIYRVRDPRAAVLARAIERLERSAPAGAGARLALARAVERAAEVSLAARHPGRALKANVEFYTAVLLEAVGVPRSFFTPTFAVARVVGWCAHVAEQRACGRIVRPASRYVGPRPAAAS